jgi:hypothetical protein
MKGCGGGICAHAKPSGGDLFMRSARRPRARLRRRNCRPARRRAASDPARISLNDPALRALARANRRALVTIAEQPQLAIDYVATFLGRLTSEEARQYYDHYIGPYFNSDSRVDLAIAQRAVAAVAAELGVASPSADQMY